MQRPCSRLEGNFLNVVNGFNVVNGMNEVNVFNVVNVGLYLGILE